MSATSEFLNQTRPNKKENTAGPDPKDYLRIGTDYYKRVFIPLTSGDHLEQLRKWSKQTIKDDLNGTTWASFSKQVAKYDGQCCIPSHLDYRQEIDGFYNTYHPISWMKKITPGDIQHSIEFMEHIFGAQVELGLDYFTLLLKTPQQKLPILGLVSEERGTGKTTLLDWLKAIFQDNLTLTRNEDFESQFNADWASKLIIAVDETLMEKKAMSERLKHLTTARFTKTEAKGKDRVETEFFGKFILTSNNVLNFVTVDELENRYWIRKVPVLKKDIPNFIEVLISEIPAFLHFLLNREMATERESRLWFKEGSYDTPELLELKRNSKPLIQKEMERMLASQIEDFELVEVKMTIGDILEKLKKTSSGFRFAQGQVQEVLRKKWKLEPVSNALSYELYEYASESPSAMRKKGRYYTFSIDFLKSLGALDADYQPSLESEPQF